MNAATPISGLAVIPVGISDISGIPPIALQIPDFEGSASIQIFSNSTQTQIGCFRAVMRNGATFSHPTAVSSVLGVFAFIALISSFAVAVYGVSMSHMRTHYGHALPVLVVFEIFQSIFFSGALNLNWPSVCVAWWSNFAWAAGMIHSKSMVSSVNSFVGVSGNASQVGGAGSTVVNNNGGLQQQIYGRSLDLDLLDYSNIARRDTSGSNNFTVDYNWAGGPVQPGLPTPGNWTGFSGELSMVDIPVEDAFIIGLLWLLVLLAVTAALVIAFKGALEGLAHMKRIKHDRLALFRTNWLGYLALIIARMMFIAIPMMLTLSLFQFALMGKAGVTAIAAILFIVFFVGGAATVGYACFYRLRYGKYESSPDKIHFERKRVFNFLPWFRTVRDSSLGDEEKTTIMANKMASIPTFRIRYIDDNKDRASVHNDEEYIKRFGWLSAHYRRTAWWFFASWFVYQFVRACFVGGAPAHPAVQVIGLFIVELIALIAVFWIRPFEGRRNTAVAVYMLSFSKAATAGLSIAFLPSYNVPRIPATVIGVVIIVIQGFLTIGLILLIILGAISTYMSLTRNQEKFIPRNWDAYRIKYFQHLEEAAPDVPKAKVVKVVEEPKIGFTVTQVRRAPKIEDEDTDLFTEITSPEPVATSSNLASARRSRTNSMRSNYSSSNIPYGARVHRMSWSAKDFEGIDEDLVASNQIRGPSSRRSTMTNSVQPALHGYVRPVASMGNIRTSNPAMVVEEESEVVKGKKPEVEQ